MLILFTFLVFGWFLRESQAIPCETAIELHRSEDRGTGCTGIYNQVCDRYAINESLWYKVPNEMGSDPQYKDMVTHPPELNQCGTSFPIWLNGSLPRSKYSDTTLTACMRGINNTCQSTYNVTIMSCNGFHVYKLRATTTCDAAYCFGRCQTSDDTRLPFLDTGLSEPCNTSHYLHRAGDRGTQCTITGDDRTPVCDRYAVSDVWYRVTNDGEDLQIVTQPPQVNSCGTSFPIWMNDTHPTDGDTVNRTACELGIDGSCLHEYNISIKSCQTYYVYKLQSTIVCDAAYCFGQNRSCDTGNPNYNSSGDHASPLAVLLVVCVTMMYLLQGHNISL
ncbi:uncharacterized protein LOC132546267 [Ylistrum balloti]|uniref:uncharacterized protein LOC132546267 n=1 Tax=Ylistrum balloti TaxID=509963 RepID=UPI002905CB53|nr:uncharacterized protein LOC132546267 [Ylistrum balloti]